MIEVLHPSEPYTFSDESKEFVPSITDISRMEQRMRYGFSPYADRPTKPIPEAEQWEALASQIREAEQRLITLQYVAKIRAEQIGNRSWLRTVLGL